MSPALFTGLAAGVVAGEPSAPVLGLLVVLAPLAALFVPSHADARPAVVAVVMAGIATAVVLAGSILAAAAVAVALGISEGQALAASVVMLSLGTVGRRMVRVPAIVVVGGVLALMGLVAAMAMGGGGAPWAAWTRLASQPYLVFSSTTEWVREGRTFAKATTFAFVETQDVTSVSGGVVRVTSPSANGDTVREWRLTAGDSLTILAGERLTAPPGSRLRFEAGKRVPGLADSGITWAAPRARPWALALADGLGIAVTLGGGAMALLSGLGGGSRAGAAAAPVFIFALALGAASWGVYAASLTPDLALGASSLAAIVAAPFTAVALGGSLEVAALIALLFASLLFATAVSWTARLDRLVAGWGPQHASVHVVAPLVAFGAACLATVLAVRDAEVHAVFRFGLGLAASAWAAPLLGGAGQGVGLGSLVGGGVFVALWVAGWLGLPDVSVLGRHPALAAAPIAAAVAALARARGARRPRPARAGCRGEETLPQ